MEDRFRPVFVRLNKAVRCREETERLWQRFDLLKEKRDRAAFPEFLRREAPEEFRASAVALFEKMYGSYRSSSPASTYQGRKFFAQIQLTGTDEQNILRLGKLLRLVARAIEDYRVWLAVRSRPALRAMILSEAIKPEGHYAVAKEVLTEWSAAVDGMPLGTWRLYQRWRFEDAVHFNSDQRKTKQKYGNLDAIDRAFKNLKDFYDAFYAMERLNRERILNIDGTATARQRRPKNNDHMLTTIYQKIYALQKSATLYEEAYEDFRSSLLAGYQELDGWHRVAIYQHLSNYFGWARRQGAKWVESQYVYWLEFLVSGDYLSAVEKLDGSFVINRMTEASITGREGLAERVRDRLLPHVTERERPGIELLINTRLLFVKDRFEELVAGYEGKVNSVRLSGYHQLIVLKSMVLRALLALRADLNGDARGNLFYQTKDSLLALLKDNPNDFSKAREREIRIFVRVCEQLFRDGLVDIEEERYKLFRERIRKESYLASRRWLGCLLAHFRPGLVPRPERIAPTGNQDAEWVSQE